MPCNVSKSLSSPSGTDRAPLLMPLRLVRARCIAGAARSNFTTTASAHSPPNHARRTANGHRPPRPPWSPKYAPCVSTNTTPIWAKPLSTPVRSSAPGAARTGWRCRACPPSGASSPAHRIKCATPRSASARADSPNPCAGNTKHAASKAINPPRSNSSPATQ